MVEFVAAPETQERLGGVAPAFAVPQGLSLPGLGSLGLDQTREAYAKDPDRAIESHKTNRASIAMMPTTMQPHANRTATRRRVL